MKGSEIKEAIRKSGFTITQVAEALGESQANFSAALSRDDLKSSLIERIATYLGVPVSFLYGEGNKATASGDGSTAVAGNGNSINDGILIDEIAAQRRLTEKALSQNDKLIGIIHNLTKPKEE